MSTPDPARLHYLSLPLIIPAKDRSPPWPMPCPVSGLILELLIAIKARPPPQVLFISPRDFTTTSWELGKGARSAADLTFACVFVFFYDLCWTWYVMVAHIKQELFWTNQGYDPSYSLLDKPTLDWRCSGNRRLNFGLLSFYHYFRIVIYLVLTLLLGHWHLLLVIQASASVLQSNH